MLSFKLACEDPENPKRVRISPGTLNSLMRFNLRLDEGAFARAELVEDLEEVAGRLRRQV
jgi:hypothetical protein